MQTYPRQAVTAFISVTVQRRHFTVILTCQDESLLLPLQSLMSFGQYQGQDSVCFLVCFGCACVFTEGEVKGMYRHEDEVKRLTVI